jgi:hypothetical protein
MFASGTGMFTVAVMVEHISIVEASPNSAIKPSERLLVAAELEGMLNRAPMFAAKSISNNAKPIALWFFMKFFLPIFCAVSIEIVFINSLLMINKKDQ